MSERAERAELFHVDMRHGRRQRAWVKNVVGVGLSYGFVEPLESTGLLTTHENIIKLVEILNRRRGWVTRTEKEGFNFAVEQEVLKFKDFISQHYALSMRDDTPYWNYCTNEHEYCPQLISDYVLQQSQYTNLLGNITSNQTYPTGFIAGLMIAAGMGVKPMSTKEMVLIGGKMKQDELEYTKRVYEKYKEYVINYVKDLPTHYEFLKQEIYGGKDEYTL
jgi:tryptophan halogenase